MRRVASLLRGVHRMEQRHQVRTQVFGQTVDDVTFMLRDDGVNRFHDVASRCSEGNFLRFSGADRTDDQTTCDQSRDEWCHVGALDIKNASDCALRCSGVDADIREHRRLAHAKAELSMLFGKFGHQIFGNLPQDKAGQLIERVAHHICVNGGARNCQRPTAKENCSTATTRRFTTRPENLPTTIGNGNIYAMSHNT